jgi:hypothetical protein
MYYKRVASSEEMLAIAECELLKIGAVSAGGVIGVVAGSTMASGATNWMRLHRVGGPAFDAPANERRKQPRLGSSNRGKKL